MTLRDFEKRVWSGFAVLSLVFCPVSQTQKFRLNDVFIEKNEPDKQNSLLKRFRTLPCDQRGDFNLPKIVFESGTNLDQMKGRRKTGTM